MSQQPSLMIDDNVVVSMHYRLSNGFGEQIDSSLGALPLVYMHNRSSLLPALERELTGHRAGDELEVTIYPEDGYGYADEELVQEFPKELLEENSTELQVGMRIQAKDKDGESQLATLKEIRDDTVVLDANHPLAGQVLHFQIAIVSVREPTDEERSDGRAWTTNAAVSG